VIFILETRRNERRKKKKSIVIFQVHPLIMFAVAQWVKSFFEVAIQKSNSCEAVF
jgi:flagellar basal body-associated protein FliL